MVGSDGMFVFTVVFDDNPSEPKCFQLQAGKDETVKIGRASKSELACIIPGVSWVHAELKLQPPLEADTPGQPQLMIRDMSMNGTGFRIPGGAETTRLGKEVDTLVPNGTTIVFPMKVAASKGKAPDQKSFTVHYGAGPSVTNKVPLSGSDGAVVDISRRKAGDIDANGSVGHRPASRAKPQVLDGASSLLGGINANGAATLQPADASNLGRLPESSSALSSPVTTTLPQGLQATLSQSLLPGPLTSLAPGTEAQMPGLLPSPMIAGGLLTGSPPLKGLPFSMPAGGLSTSVGDSNTWLPGMLPTTGPLTVSGSNDSTLAGWTPGQPLPGLTPVTIPGATGDAWVSTTPVQVPPNLGAGSVSAPLAGSTDGPTLIPGQPLPPVGTLGNAWASSGLTNQASPWVSSSGPGLVQAASAGKADTGAPELTPEGTGDGGNPPWRRRKLESSKFLAAAAPKSGSFGPPHLEEAPLGNTDSGPQGEPPWRNAGQFRAEALSHAVAKSSVAAALSVKDPTRSASPSVAANKAKAAMPKSAISNSFGISTGSGPGGIGPTMSKDPRVTGADDMPPVSKRARHSPPPARANSGGSLFDPEAEPEPMRGGGNGTQRRALPKPAHASRFGDDAGRNPSSSTGFDGYPGVPPGDWGAGSEETVGRLHNGGNGNRSRGNPYDILLAFDSQGKPGLIKFNKGGRFIRAGHEAEDDGKLDEAYEKYRKGLKYVIEGLPHLGDHDPRVGPLREMVTKYLDRAQSLKDKCDHLRG